MLRTLQCAAAVMAAVSFAGCGSASRPGAAIDTSYIEVMATESSTTPVTESGSLPPGSEPLNSKLTKPVAELSPVGLLSFAEFADAGSFSSGEEGAYVGGVNAEQATAEAFDRGGARDFSVETLRSTDTEQLILVNRLGLAFGPVEDERLLLLYRQTGGPQAAVVPKGMWRVVQAGRQQRCRGADESRWTASPCR